jgi:hypothetical protein
MLRETRTSVVVHRIALILALAAYALLAVPLAHAQQDPTTGSRAEIDRARAALEKYRDPVVAIHDGYFSTLGCVQIAHAGGAGQVPYQPGGMGIHFLNTSLVGPTPDPARPQVLIYEPQGDSLRLVAAEWYIPLATGVKQRPTLWGQPFDGPMEGHHPLMPAALSHYDLHVWLFKPNPHGLYSPTNPDLKCGDYAYTVVEEAPKLVPVPQR